MDEKQFWEYIDQANNSECFHSDLKNALYNLELQEIISFKKILLDKLVESYTFPLLEANFVISSYVSDDGFQEFRAWLVSNGSNRFNNAINDPETIAEWLDIDKVDHIEGEDFLYIADEVYIEKGGDEDNFYNQTIYPSEPDIQMEWPENKEDFKQKYPKLVAKFWNQQRIQDLHS